LFERSVVMVHAANRAAAGDIASDVITGAMFRPSTMLMLNKT
jgi:hypothetical protein